MGYRTKKQLDQQEYAWLLAQMNNAVAVLIKYNLYIKSNQRTNAISPAAIPNIEWIKTQLKTAYNNKSNPPVDLDPYDYPF